MKTKYCLPVIFFAVITAITTACSLESSDNGDLDGMWRLTAVDTLATNGTKDMEGTRLYWSVQAKLLQLDDKNNTNISLLLRFEHTGNTLRLYEPYIYNRLEGDKPLNDVTLLAPYGINALEESCEVEALSSSKMILKTPSLRLKFKKSN